MKTSTRKNTSPPKKWQTLGTLCFKWTCCGPSSLKTLFLLMAPKKKGVNSLEIIMSFTLLIYDIHHCPIPQNQILKHQLFRQREIVKPSSGEIPSNRFQPFQCLKPSHQTRPVATKWHCFEGSQWPPGIGWETLPASTITERENLNWPHKKSEASDPGLLHGMSVIYVKKYIDRYIHTGILYPTTCLLLLQEKSSVI